jgi:hypothetical protein
MVRDGATEHQLEKRMDQSHPITNRPMSPECSKGNIRTMNQEYTSHQTRDKVFYWTSNIPCKNTPVPQREENTRRIPTAWKGV